MFIRRNGCIASTLLLAVLSLAGAIATSAQNVPPTARAAAASPQFASRLARRGTAPQGKPAHRRSDACNLSQKDQQGLLPEDVLYSNGPINGTQYGWMINFGFAVSDSFPGGGPPTGLTFGAWLYPGDALQSAEISITSSEFGGTTYFDGTVTFTQGACFSNGSFNVCAETGTFNGPVLPTGTLWVNLRNAVSAARNPVYWDQNSGPSLASESSVGTIPSESFTLNGNPNFPPCMSEQQGGFQVIHDFSGETDGGNPEGVAIDRAGNLYGAASDSLFSFGSVYKLAQAGSAWMLSTLYNFTGANDGEYPSEAIVGNNGILYGAARGGIGSCELGQPCGLIFGLRPSPTVCLATPCYWRERVLYQFAGLNDAWRGGNLVSDGSGNLYGVSAAGGSQQQGAVFELSPSIGGWIETVLYSFSGNRDGGDPTDVLVGSNGKLYGMAAEGGLYGSGVVFQLSPSGNGWDEAVLYDIPASNYDPRALLQDSAGNLYGTYAYSNSDNYYGTIFMLAPSGNGWIFTDLHDGDRQYPVDGFSNLIMDSAGNLYGTGGGAYGCDGQVSHGYIFELSRTGNGWQYSTPVFWGDAYFPAYGTLALDSRGNLYGTTGFCGVHNYGTIWQFSP